MQAAPIGPGSLLWRLGGDWRSVFAGPAAGLLQLMFPPLGSAVAEQSGFFADPTARIFRSVPQIWATIFADDAQLEARRIRELHRDIKGVDSTGHRYHALEPETFWWAHATFTWMIFRSLDWHPAGTLDEAGREQLYAETLTWYERYGVSTRPVPPDYVAFQRTFDRWCAERLEITPAVHRALAVAREGGDHSLPVGPRVLYRAGRPMLNHLAVMSSVGGLPPQVRERFDIPWSDAEQRRLDSYSTAARAAFRLVPWSLNHRTFINGMRILGNRTRDERYVPAS